MAAIKSIAAGRCTAIRPVCAPAIASRSPVPNFRCNLPSTPTSYLKCRHNLSPARNVKAQGIFDEDIDPRLPRNPDPALFNEDFAPVSVEGRHWDTWDFASFWITLVISIPTYFLAASLVDLGMSWVQGIATVFVGNLVTLLPMVLNAHPGTKYGIPFPVLARASFGIKGANLPSLSRALVACGWFGIQTWIGGSSIYQMLTTVAGDAVRGPVIDWLGISLAEFACFLAFWGVQVWIVAKGMESIRALEKYSAPLLIALSVALLAWALSAAGGFGPMLSTPSQFAAGMPKEGQFWSVFLPSVTANVGFWGTLSLNIPDFTRYARSQKDQILGQAIGLPLFMALFTFLGLAVTSATVVIYGEAIVDPVQLLGKMEGLLPILTSLFGLMWATLTTNIAANIVAPANAFVNVAPRVITFTLGSFITAAIGLIIMPWKLISSSSGFINTWLVGYSALLGPVIGIVMSDYWLVRQRTLDVDSLYSQGEGTEYWYKDGWNPAALVAMVLGVLPTMPGFLATLGVLTDVSPFLMSLYDMAWFVGVAVSSLVYCSLMWAGVGQPQVNKTVGNGARS
mmetsp:Transcript_23671/g.51937  ORF Transcript_23671/g.51937 Transcript_23671/m.51937 type:complete len:568 (+) Transcript_23671:24-1727(+)